MPGVITCGLGEGDAVGICMPGVITCVLGEGLGLVVLLLVPRLAEELVLFFATGRLGFGFAAEGLGITWPSCCGNALPPSANTSVKEQSVRNVLLL